MMEEVAERLKKLKELEAMLMSRLSCLGIRCEDCPFEGWEAICWCITERM